MVSVGWPGAISSAVDRRERVAVDELASMTVPALPAAPLFVGLAHVVVPPGVATEDVGTAGPRLLVVESGAPTVGLAEGAEASISAGSAPPVATWVRVTPGTDVVLDPGDRLVVGARGLRAIRNDGARPAVYLDAALFPAGARPVPAAFTTDAGVSFQLLASVVVDAAPTGAVEFTLARIRLGRGGALPGVPRTGPALAYVESGSLGLVSTAGEVRFSRAASPAPYSTPGPMRPIAIGAPVTLTAGASVFLPTGSAVATENGRDVPVALLMLEVRPAPAQAAPPAIVTLGPGR